MPPLLMSLVFSRVRAAFGRRLRFAFSGGAPLAPRLAEWFHGAGVLVLEGYGLTETTSATHVNTAADPCPGTVGRPLPGVEARLAPDGEVLVRGRNVCAGYWNRPALTAQLFDDEGWMRTGDVGHLDEDGFLFITDRAKDMIIRGGENVYCVEIENRLVEHPAIADAAVIGVPHPSLGEEVKAVVQVEPGRSITEAEVKAWVAETLADFKVPAYVDLTDERLPRNASGKLLKNVLRGEGEVSFAETM